jgi:hypothetical protein
VLFRSGTVWCAVDVRLVHVGGGIEFAGDYARSIQLHIAGDEGVTPVNRLEPSATTPIDRREEPEPLVDPHAEHHEGPKEPLREGQSVHGWSLARPR